MYSRSREVGPLPLSGKKENPACAEINFIVTYEIVGHGWPDHREEMNEA